MAGLTSGPRRVPTALKKARGTYRAGMAKFRGYDKEPEAKLEMPEPPAELTERAKESWRYFAEIVYNMGVVTKQDRTALWNLCEIHAMLKIALEQYYSLNGKTWIEEEVFDKEGNLKARRIKEHPLVSTVRKLQKDLWNALAHFGLSPTDRSRVAVIGEAKGKDAPVSGWEKLN